jgi:hypothetical protein
MVVEAGRKLSGALRDFLGQKVKGTASSGNGTGTAA